ncbi:alpha/beta-hydrolase [Coemansia reversa NRRL 1564]|uniref:sn-1-specific diacylglycerol lipase n=1 Tax=Coemansia reversa (strain ATCC 12441 / NRRL 1564) TaxID=763665 RepID=A0A2G5B4E1_COERN|nr:alpha/beta-hydrolase [Coemansia reversa NRRL 1564]|eukprot:PIA13874.1 alpha/beta-hydrolase [Coemansia reversa NRRL 1564]
MFNEGVELSNTELLAGLLTLYKFYNEAEIPGVMRPCKGDIVDNTRPLEIPGRYARFALASYGWRGLYFFNRGITLMDGAKVDSDVTSVLQYLGITQEDLLGYEFRSSQLFCPSYFVAYDRQHDAVVLVVRGTMSAEDTVVDLSCEYSKWNGGLVHSGMKASAHWLFLEVMPQIFAYASSQRTKSICIVGHSLGASTAAILTIMLHEYRSHLSNLGIDMAKFDIRGYCYGPAPCISDDIADRYRDIIQTYVNRDDLVPRLCYGSVSDFRRMSISAADEADNLAQRLYAPFESSAQQQQRWNEKFARLMDIRKDILATQENLHLALPGTIYHIVSYRGVSSNTSAPRNISLEVAIARRQLFGVTNSIPEKGTENVAESGDEPPVLPPPPPPTPKTIVQQDSVSSEDLADAINTPLREGFEASRSYTLATSGKDTETEKRSKTFKSVDSDSGTRKNSAVSAAGAGGSDTFVPVWVQQVPNNAFREIILRPTIVTDHMPSAYEMAFAHAIETQIYERQLRERRSKK